MRRAKKRTTRTPVMPRPMAKVIPFPPQDVVARRSRIAHQRALLGEWGCGEMVRLLAQRETDRPLAFTPDPLADQVRAFAAVVAASINGRSTAARTPRR
jgi:hypothetical protein